VVKQVISPAGGPTILNSENSESSLIALQEKNKRTTQDQNWKVGSSCRAIYCEDNLEYEAKIIEILEGGSSVVVKFVGMSLLLFPHLILFDGLGIGHLTEYHSINCF